MQVNLFRRGGTKVKPAEQFNDLEDEINSWLAEHPEITIEPAHRLSQPTLGRGERAVAVWYSEPTG